MKTLFLVVFCFALVACSGTKKVHQSESKTEVTREHIVKFKDTVIPVPSSRSQLKLATIEFQNDLLQPRTFESKSGRATSRIRITKDTVYVTSECDSLALRAQIKQELTNNSQLSATSVHQEDKRGVSRFTLIMWCTILFLAGIGIGILLKTFLI